MKIIKEINKYLLIMATMALMASGCGSDSSSEVAFSDNGGNTTGQGGSLARFTIMGDTLYTARHAAQSTIRAYSISNPATIQEVGSYPQNFVELETLFPLPSRNFLLSGSTTGMLIFKPTFQGLVEIGRFTHARSCDPVVANDEYAFVTLRDGRVCNQGLNQLDVLDIRNPQNVMLIKTELLNRPKGLALDGNVLFVCEEDKLSVFNVTDPANLFRVQSIDIVADDVIARNGILMVMSRIGISQYTYNTTGTQLTFLRDGTITYTP